MTLEGQGKKKKGRETREKVAALLKLNQNL